MLYDDDAVKKPKAAPKPLDAMSVAELENYIADLTAEIERVKAEIARKKAHMNAASSLFGKSG